MKEIKSVRLKREYRDTTHILFANQYATKIPDCKGGAFWQFKTEKDCQYSFSEQTIRNNYTDLFEIEYEQERKYIDVRIEFSNLDFSDFYPDVITSLKRKIKKQFEYANVKVTKLGEGIL